MTVPNTNCDARSHKVAIIVPVFNAAATLAATLESALAQDVPVDVVAIDDGSTDYSLAIAREFEPKLRVITGPNRGASHARNVGITETAAEWLVFLDSDDLLERGTLFKRLQIAWQSNADVVICDWIDIGDCVPADQTPERRSIDWAAMTKNAELATAVHVWAPPAAILYRRDVVERIGGFRSDLPVIQDARFLFDAACCGARFAHSRHIGARYRKSERSLSGEIRRGFAMIYSPMACRSRRFGGAAPRSQSRKSTRSRRFTIPRRVGYSLLKAGIISKPLNANACCRHRCHCIPGSPPRWLAPWD